MITTMPIIFFFFRLATLGDLVCIVQLFFLSVLFCSFLVYSSRMSPGLLLKIEQPPIINIIIVTFRETGAIPTAAIPTRVKVGVPNLSQPNPDPDHPTGPDLTQPRLSEYDGGQIPLSLAIYFGPHLTKKINLRYCHTGKHSKYSCKHLEFGT